MKHGHPDANLSKVDKRLQSVKLENFAVILMQFYSRCVCVSCQYVSFVRVLGKFDIICRIFFLLSIW